MNLDDKKVTTFVNQITSSILMDKSLALPLDRQIAYSIYQVESSRSEALLRLSQIRLDAYNRERFRQQKLDDHTKTKESCDAINPSFLELDNRCPQNENELEVLKDKLDRYLDQANSLLNKLSLQRNAIEEAYVKEIKDQAHDLKLLRQQMKGETSKHVFLQDKERIEIDKSFANDKERTIQHQRIELDSLLEKKAAIITSNRKVKEENEQHCQIEKKQVEMKERDEYNQIKVQFESDIEALENKLLMTKIGNKFDSDKQQYESIILKEKNNDSESKLNESKRERDKIERQLKDKREQFEVIRLKNEKEIASIQKEVSNSLTRLKELKSKKDHFDKHDKEKHKCILRMHQEDINNIRQDIWLKAHSISCDILGK